ncbi:MAG TPA: hypothetical protein VLJ58_16060 [Ramlibacter sp.]|nr:hypothetical protein [Ramlibacter sp.]
MSARDDLDVILVPGQDDGLRRAALALHGLSPADREWMIERLPVHKRDALQELLQELTVLGIPADPQLAGLAAQAPRAAPAGAALQAVAPAAETVPVPLRLERAADVAVVLAAQSAGFAARCLQLGSPTWRQAVIAQLPPELAQDVREIAVGSGSQPCPPRLRKALLDGLESALPKGEAQPAVLARPVRGRLSGLVALLKAER